MEGPMLEHLKETTSRKQEKKADASVKKEQVVSCNMN